MNMKPIVWRGLSGMVKSLGVALLSVLLLVGGCSQNPDIRHGHGSSSGITQKYDDEFFDCIKSGIHAGAEVFVVKEGETSSFFVGNPDPIKAAGLVEISGSQSDRKYSVYQRHAWYDQGRLITTAVRCSKV